MPTLSIFQETPPHQTPAADAHPTAREGQSKYPLLLKHKQSKQTKKKTPNQNKRKKIPKANKKCLSSQANLSFLATERKHRNLSLLFEAAEEREVDNHSNKKRQEKQGNSEESWKNKEIYYFTSWDHILLSLVSVLSYFPYTYYTYP